MLLTKGQETSILRRKVARSWRDQLAVIPSVIFPNIARTGRIKVQDRVPMTAQSAGLVLIALLKYIVPKDDIARIVAVWL